MRSSIFDILVKYWDEFPACTSVLFSRLISLGNVITAHVLIKPATDTHYDYYNAK